MRVAIVRLTWLRSVSDDVVEQRLVVNGNVDGVVVLAPSVEQYDIRVSEKETVSVALTAFDGKFESDAVVLDYAVGDLTKPQSPTGLFAEVIEVVEE